MVSNPLPLALLALNLLLPGIFLLALLPVRRMFKEGLTAFLVAFGIGLGAWILATHGAALAMGSLAKGMTLSSVTLGALGYGLWLRDRKRPAPPLSWLLRPTGHELLFLAVSSVVMGILAWRWGWHDEISVNGHHAMVASIQNTYPPRNLSFPRHPLQYHYGFNLVCAMATGLWRLSVTHAIDVVTIGLWTYTAAALCLLGARLVGRNYGVVFGWLALLGGGFPFTCKESYGSIQPLGGHLLNSCSVSGALLNPPVISYFFQHPWSLGLPLAACALLLQAEDRDGNKWLRLGLLCLLLLALCLAQTALFFAVTGACAASELLDERDMPLGKRLLSVLALLLVLAAGSLGLGGLWTGSNVGSLLTFHLGIVATLKASLEWTYLTFGVLLVGVFGVFGLTRRRFLFMALGVGCVILINVVQYKDTWDMAKFATLGTIGLAMMLTGLLKMLRGVRFPTVRVAPPVVLAALTTFSGASFALALVFNLPGTPSMYLQVPPALPEHDRLAAEYVREHLPRGEIMYRAFNYHRPYACYAGLPQVWVENAFPLNVKLLPARTKLVTDWPDKEALYRAEGIRFFVISRFEGKVEQLTDKWIARGTAVERRRFGILRIVELLDGPTPQKKQPAPSPSPSSQPQSMH